MALNYKNSLARYRRYLQVMQSQPLWRTSLWVVLSLILVIVLVVAALRPTLVTIASLLGQIKQQRELALKLDNKIVTVQKASAALENLRPRMSLLDEALPIAPQWDSFADKVSKMATDSGIVLTDMSLGNIPTTGKITNLKSILPAGVSGVQFSISGYGQYAQLEQFVDSLESIRRLAVLSAVKIDKQKDGSLVLNVTGEIGYVSEAADQ